MYKKSKKHNIISKNKERVEILDFYEETVYEDESKFSKVKNLFKTNKLLLVLSLLIIFTIFQFNDQSNVISQSARRVLDNLGIYTQEITETEIASLNIGKPASWKIKKSTKWLTSTTASLTIDVQTVSSSISKEKDIIILVDNSKSMEGNKVATLKKSLISTVNGLLSDGNNRVALVAFNDTASILTGFTKDKDLLTSKINSIVSINGTSYSAALKSINTIMSSYIKESDREVKTILITDGLPTINVGVQKSNYEIIKDKYPYMNILGIQYEVDKEIMDDLKSVTDKQFKASIDTIEEVLNEAMLSPTKFEEFTLTEYINDDYFEVKSLDNIKTTIGKAMILEEDRKQKIKWNLGSKSFATGRSGSLNVVVSLKKDFQEKKGFYRLNSKTLIDTKMPNEKLSKREVNSPLVLKNVYTITYDVNTPINCNLEKLDSVEALAYKRVVKPDKELKCDGYLFKGWFIADEDNYDITNINDDAFIMPTHDVTLRATWSRQAITKSMDGEVYEKTTLYKVVENEVKNNLALEYTGNHKDSLTGNMNEKIYYYSAKTDKDKESIADKNNVIFGNYCWQIFRTTDTGGVKLIYNGEPDEEGRCNNSRTSHVGYQNATVLNLSGTYYYGTSYIYDKNTHKFILSGEVSNTMWNDYTSGSLIGKYTCKGSSADDTCSTLYYIEDYNDGVSAKVLPLATDVSYHTIGQLPYSNQNNSLSNLGYMYNVAYPSKSRLMTSSETVIKSTKIVKGMVAAHGFNYENGYILDDPVESGDYKEIVGKYTFGDTNKENKANIVRYIVSAREDTYYFIELIGGEDISHYNDTYTYGESVTRNEDGTYTINNPRTIERVDWLDNYDNLRGKYACKNTTTNSCEGLFYIVDRKRPLEITENNINNIGFMFIQPTSNYKYAKSVTYENGVYKLNDDGATFWNIYDEDNFKKLENAHYTCFNEAGVCENVSYIYSYPALSYQEDWQLNKTYVDYIVLSNGVNINGALKNMLSSDDVNKNSSALKKAIDAWYEKNLKEYDSYIDDTIFCNDRSIKNLGGWNPNGGSLNSTLTFNGNSDLSCQNVTDMFSVSNDKAKLKYKIGLPSLGEARMINNYQSSTYWVASPNSFNKIAFNNTSVGNSKVNDVNSLRPVITLVKGIEFIEGEGSMDYPYVIDTEK